MVILQIAAAYAAGGPYHGASAAIPIWKVHVEPNEFSKNYLLIASPHERRFVPIKGKRPPDILNQIAVGMANDGGDKSHCLNHECGFIQTNNQFALGTAFSNESRAGGELDFVKVSLYRQTGPAVWWLSINDVAIGYFNSGMFAVPFVESFYHEMGGRVLNSMPGGKHTSTQMGSGMFPSAGLRNAASIVGYLAFNNNGGDLVDDPVNIIATSPKCYDAKDFGRDLNYPGIDVAYGGPGGPECDR
ncbi:hypothetical protein HU200_049918 [Digitaria exilis]|uniref:Neprosin PEP catalytic domain-containing protein n=1 Tax=Digitaria exilis TaxID=1010633 RepID=A0A835AYQ9_9POAL|nr:hypothetical protein HU200_049918 [Digitaria exilis]